MNDIFAEVKRPSLAQRQVQLQNAIKDLEYRKNSLSLAKYHGNKANIKFFTAMVASCEKHVDSIKEIIKHETNLK